MLELRILSDVIKHLYETHASICVVHCTGNVQNARRYFYWLQRQIVTSQGMPKSEKMYGAEMSKAP